MLIKRLLLLVLISTSIFALTRCEKVSEPFIKDVSVKGERKVLLEKFTGHMCNNCPEANEIAHDLKDVYGDKLVLISIHAGFQAKPLYTPYDYDFRTNEGTEIDNYFGISASGVPSGLVNRRERSGSVMINPNTWAVAIGEVINKEPDALIKIQSDYNNQSRKLSLDIETEFLTDPANDTYYLAAFITEDNIIKPQLTKDSISYNYNHMHVLRGAVNGTWGEQIDANITDSKSYQITLDNEWKEKDCHIVAYIYKDSNKEIIQAEEIKVIE